MLVGQTVSRHRIAVSNTRTGERCGVWDSGRGDALTRGVANNYLFTWTRKKFKRVVTSDEQITDLFYVV